MSLYTLQFNSYAEARSAAIALGFWDTQTDQLKTDGQSADEDGKVYGWNITYCGQRLITPAVVDAQGETIEPAVMSTEVYAIVTGQLPPTAMAYLAPFYGFSGHFYSDATEPRPHE